MKHDSFFFAILFGPCWRICRWLKAGTSYSMSWRGCGKGGVTGSTDEYPSAVSSMRYLIADRDIV